MGRDIFVSKDNNQSNRYLNLQNISSLLSLLLLWRNKLVTHATNVSFSAQHESVGKEFFYSMKGWHGTFRHQAPLCNQAKTHYGTFDAKSVQWMWMVIGKNECGSTTREKLKAK